MATRNYVPRANGEGGIGTEKKHWSSAFFDKISVKALEVIGGGENDAQPATVGWVKNKFRELLVASLSFTGVRWVDGENGFIALGSLFGGIKIQWGMFAKETWETDPVWGHKQAFAFPIEFTKKYSIVLFPVKVSTPESGSAYTYKEYDLRSAQIYSKNPQKFNFIAVGI